MISPTGLIAMYGFVLPCLVPFSSAEISLYSDVREDFYYFCVKIILPKDRKRTRFFINCCLAFVENNDLLTLNSRKMPDLQEWTNGKQWETASIFYEQ